MCCWTGRTEETLVWSPTTSFGFAALQYGSSLSQKQLLFNVYTFLLKGNLSVRLGEGTLNQEANQSPPEFSASLILPQHRYVLHCRLTLSFTAQWNTNMKKPTKPK